MKDDVAGCVAGAMANRKNELPDSYIVAVNQPARRLELLPWDAIFRPILGKTVDPVTVRLVRTFDRDFKFIGKKSSASAMVDMAVGQEELLDRRPALRRGGLEPRQVAARIDDRAAHRRCAPQQGAILLERRDGDDRRS